MKKLDVCGLGNALVDLLFECSDSEFAALNMQKGGMRLIDAGTQKKILSQLGTPVRKASGGSVANSVALVGQLGGRAGLICSIADDRYGEFFESDLALLGVEVSSGSPGSDDSETGTSLVVVTPDAERSMSTCLAASANLMPLHIKEELVADSRWVFIEGYVVANSDAARESILTLLRYAKKAGTRVAITLSDAFVVNGFRDFLNEVLPQVDLIFCNEIEAAALSGEEGIESAFEKLRESYSGIVLTAGPGGVYVSFDGSVGHVAACACSPVDLTGAGDAFAGAFLHGLCSKLSPFESAQRGCFYASKVIQQWGARLRADMQSLHAEFVGLSS